MNFGAFAKRAERFVSDNKPTILTVIGVTGTVASVVFTGTAAFKAATIIRDEEHNNQENMPTRMKFDLTWKLYIPAAGTAALTLAAIICANRVSTRRAAALASAYSLSEKAFDEYKKKVVEKFGEKKEQSVRDEVAQDRINANPAGDKEVHIISGGTVLCYEMFTGRYFQSDVETLRKAENDVNREIINNSYASLTDFYDRIGLPKTSESDELGWNTDEMLELYFSTTMSDDNRPCIAIDFRAKPIRSFYRHGG